MRTENAETTMANAEETTEKGDNANHDSNASLGNSTNPGNSATATTAHATTETKRKTMNRLVYILLAATMLTLAACDSNVMYNENRRINEQGWNMDDSLVFNLEADDTNSTYLCCLDIRNRNDYPYSNIYFFITTIYPDGSVAADTNIEFVLAERDGRWLGKENGRYVDGRYPFCYFHFPQQGSYQFVVRHAMRDTLLPGIKNVGMHIERTE